MKRIKYDMTHPITRLNSFERLLSPRARIVKEKKPKRPMGHIVKFLHSDGREYTM